MKKLNMKTLFLTLLTIFMMVNLSIVAKIFFAPKTLSFEEADFLLFSIRGACLIFFWGILPHAMLKKIFGFGKRTA